MSTVNPAPRRGWCPGLARPMPTGDGLLVRLHPIAGCLTADQARAAARAAREGGNGLLDVVVGTGRNWPDPRGRRVDAFTARTGRNLPGWPVTVDGRVIASPAIGDLDGDGRLDVSFASDFGWVYAYSATGRRMWRSCNGPTVSSCQSGYSTEGGTSIADVDANTRSIDCRNAGPLSAATTTTLVSPSRTRVIDALRARPADARPARARAARPSARSRTRRRAA